MVSPLLEFDVLKCAFKDIDLSDSFLPHFANIIFLTSWLICTCVFSIFFYGVCSLPVILLFCAGFLFFTKIQWHQSKNISIEFVKNSLWFLISRKKLLLRGNIAARRSNNFPREIRRYELVFGNPATNRTERPNKNFSQWRLSIFIPGLGGCGVPVSLKWLHPWEMPPSSLHPSSNILRELRDKCLNERVCHCSVFLFL